MSTPHPPHPPPTRGDAPPQPVEPAGPRSTRDPLTLVGTAVGALLALAAFGVAWILFVPPAREATSADERFARIDRRRVEGFDWPAFRSVTSDGAQISNADLRGRIVIADFLALECSACPDTSVRIADLQERLAGLDATFVSFAVEAGADREACNRYRHKFRRADTARWWIVLADDQYLPEMLAACGLAHTAEHARLGAWRPKSRFFLLDRRGRLRGAYVSTDPAQLDWLARDADALAREDAPRDGAVPRTESPPR